LTEGFDRVAAVAEFSYVLGFSPAGLKEDGSFHSLKIRVPNEEGVRVEARGYYALKHDAAEEAARPDIDDAVFWREEMSGIPVGLRTRYSKSGAGYAKLTVMAIVDLRSLHFQKVGGRNHDVLTLVAALLVRDAGGKTMSPCNGEVTIP
jgi:hypothetical protein